MKPTGVIRRIDNLGRIVIPMEIRRSLNINDDDPLEVSTEGQTVMLRSAKCVCHFCGEDAKGGIWLRGTPICALCIAEVKKS